MKSTFSILITTKNRLTDLAFTLSKIRYLILDDSVSCVVFDDGSTDGTFEFLKENYPNLQVKRNEVSKGYMYCRNEMLNESQADYAISLDDDAHFVTENPIAIIRNHFEENTHCGLLALRIFWGLEEPSYMVSNEISQQVQGFVGCAHVWRLTAWRSIPQYPEWFVFYGEENFASFQLFKENWEIHYLPEVLVHHRVDVKSRKSNTDYMIRLRWSLRSGWYLFFMFYPLIKIPRQFTYSLWIQFKLKVFKGDFKALQAILLALFDLVRNTPRILKNSNRLTSEEYTNFHKLEEAKVYWNPKNKSLIEKN